MTTQEGHRLKLFMRHENLKQHELGAVLGLDQSEISRYIRGVRTIPLQVVKALHLKYKLNYSWFFHGTGPMKVAELEPKRLMNDLTDILASLSVLMANQESMRATVNKLASDFYAGKLTK